MNLFRHITLDREAEEMLHAGLPPEVQLIAANGADPEERQFERFSECEIAFGNIPASWLSRSAALRWLQLESVGFEAYNGALAEFGRRGVLTNLHGFFGQPVAESALAGIMALKRGIDRLTLLKERQEWEGSTLRPQLGLLQGAKTLIAGGGNIGHSIRKLLSGFDAEILIYDRHPERGDLSTTDAFDGELPSADVVIACLPENEASKHFFNERRFALMPPSALFVNVGRGGVVDEPALIKRLKEGQIAGAVLDVSCTEPLPHGHELWNCPNTVITQHTGGGSKGEQTGKVAVFLDNLSRYIAGQPLKRIVTAG
ncbi:MAG: D-2-hydroxyacid dehydrogenase [Bacteroidales bacterium]|jgi:phosphoglycerate dehydrogenase-like enzyme|nr:D-2-hydroxyacid dehydrogenase [Bacteroidales bacterium]